jgi:hypothetical protein
MNTLIDVTSGLIDELKNIEVWFWMMY